MVDSIINLLGERCSIIFQITKDNTSFICNRNSDGFEQIFSDKYVRFWEVKELSSLNMIDADDCKILEIIHLSNYNLKDQKLLNKIKQKWIDELQVEEIQLSNKQFATIKKGYRNYYHELYNNFRNELYKIENINDKIYEYAKKIFYKENNQWFYKMSNFDIWNDDRLNNEQKVICILLKNYLLDAKYIKKQKYPFTTNIKRQIKILISNAISLKKYKNIH